MLLKPNDELLIQVPDPPVDDEAGGVLELTGVLLGRFEGKPIIAVTSWMGDNTPAIYRMEADLVDIFANEAEDAQQAHDLALNQIEYAIEQLRRELWAVADKQAMVAFGQVLSTYALPNDLSEGLSSSPRP